MEQAVPLRPEDLAWRCPPAWLQFQTTGDISTFDELALQDEALAALRLGLTIRARGYNVYVAGLPGTGRTSTVRSLLREERSGTVPDDLVYVHNLRDPRAPRFMRLQAGRGKVLRDAMTVAADTFRQGLSALRASGAHRRRRDRVARRFREQQGKVLAQFQDEVARQGFATVEVNLGPTRRHQVAPLVDGHAVPIGELPALVKAGKLTREQADAFDRAYSDLSARLADVSARLRAIAFELEQALAEADREGARPLVEESLDEIRERVGLAAGQNPNLDHYLEESGEFLLAVFPALFAAGEAAPLEAGDDGAGDPLEALRVHVLVDRTGQEGRPVVEESQPSAARLLGYVDVQRLPDGTMRAELGGLRAGALHHADGGFLLVNAHDLMNEDGAWPALRRALRTGRVPMHLVTAGDGPPPLVPAEAPIDVTVVLVGSLALRDALAQGDEEFGKLFKVTALLEDRGPLSQEAVRSYANYVARTAARERLVPFDAGAVARLVESMVRLSGARTKLSTRFRLMTDLARESSWHAREAGAAQVADAHVDRAIEARRTRQGMLSRRIRESIEEGTLLLDVHGLHAGQVNALAVVETSLERFGYPVRVTATASVGRSGIIDIEREAELSGEIHTKASLILAGWLRSRFARLHPLAVTASLCFEQSYGGIEGDSASCAELIALLSSLAEVPVRQDLALTGAVDQQGNILAVGGVNEKVEGFWRICRARGLTGTQGVVLPASSVETLQLDPDLVADVAAGRFTVYAVRRVEQVAELLLGVPLGEPAADGAWPPGSLGLRIASRLREMAESMRSFGDVAGAPGV